MGFRQGRTVCTLRCSAQARTTAARYCKASACTAKPSTLSGAGFVPFRVSDSVDTCTSAQQPCMVGMCFRPGTPHRSGSRIHPLQRQHTRCHLHASNGTICNETRSGETFTTKQLCRRNVPATHTSK